jgi:hypothetical protein
MSWRITDGLGIVILTNGDEGPIEEVAGELIDFAAGL